MNDLALTIETDLENLELEVYQEDEKYDIIDELKTISVFCSDTMNKQPVMLYAEKKDETSTYHIQISKVDPLIIRINQINKTVFLFEDGEIEMFERPERKGDCGTP